MLINDQEVMDLPTPNGPMRTFIYRPAAPGRYPGVLLYSEIFQVTGPIRRTAAWLAGHGYLVAVPEVYHEFLPAGTVLPYDAAGAERGNALKTTKELAAYDADAHAALEYLAGHPAGTGRVGTLGICLGGHLAFRAARQPLVRASACLYPTDLHLRGLGAGRTDDTLATAAGINGELLLIWGRQDPHIPDPGRRVVYEALTAAQRTFTWHEFNGQHAFLRDEGVRYDPELAQITQRLILDLFHRRLGGPDLPV